jgi:hypothetical protein
VDTGSRRGSERLRRAAIRSVLAGWLSVAPAEVPLRRLMPGERPAAVLAIGNPTPWLCYRGRGEGAGRS